MRGNRQRCRLAEPPIRSIPAYAGEPCANTSSTESPAVYPRVCGGTFCPNWNGGWIIGLSPRMRGNRKRTTTDGCEAGSIPAYAGEPAAYRRLGWTMSVYPRVCGGTPRRRPAPSRLSGLSPRMRGNRNATGSHPGRRRSIPAYAGEPSPASSSTPPRRVYPRVCGGTYTQAIEHRAVRGLSPRMRGNLVESGSDRPDAGSIPAYAGEPRMQSAPRRQHGVYPRVCGGTSFAPMFADWA